MVKMQFRSPFPEPKEKNEGEEDPPTEEKRRTEKEGGKKVKGFFLLQGFSGFLFLLSCGSPALPAAQTHLPSLSGPKPPMIPGNKQTAPPAQKIPPTPPPRGSVGSTRVVPPVEWPGESSGVGPSPSGPSSSVDDSAVAEWATLAP